MLEFVQDDLYYPSFEEKLTHIVFSICTGHNFNDGNKRFSLTLGAYFLYINEYYWAATTFLSRMEDISLLVARGLVTKEQLLVFVRPIFNCLDFDEEAKLLLLELKSKSIKPDEEW